MLLLIVKPNPLSNTVIGENIYDKTNEYSTSKYEEPKTNRFYFHLIARRWEGCASMQRELEETSGNPSPNTQYLQMLLSVGSQVMI